MNLTRQKIEFGFVAWFAFASVAVGQWFQIGPKPGWTGCIRPGPGMSGCFTVVPYMVILFTALGVVVGVAALNGIKRVKRGWWA